MDRPELEAAMKVLLAVDGSDYTKRMLDYLGAHGELLGASHEYTALTVVTPIPPHAARHIERQTLDSYINYWVVRPFIIVKGNQRGKIEMHAVVAPKNVSHRRAAELTGGTVLNIEGDFSGPLAALGDRIADTVAVALDPVGTGAALYKKSLRVLVDGQEVRHDPANGWVFDELTHSIRF